VLTAVAVVALVGLGLRYLRVGRQIYAIGSNPAAAAFYGLKTPRVVFQAYVMCGLLTGLAAFLFGARAGYIVPYLAQGLELTALAAVVIGGVSVLGGSGNVAGAADWRGDAGHHRQRLVLLAPPTSPGNSSRAPPSSSRWSSTR